MIGYPKGTQTGEKAKKRRKKPRNERTTLENKLTNISAKICRLIGKCEACGKSNCVLNAHHFKSRKYHGVKWYLPNLICLCVHCHTFSFTFSAHKTPEAFRLFMIKRKGQAWADDIEKRAQDHKNWKLDELKAMLEELKRVELQRTAKM